MEPGAVGAWPRSIQIKDLIIKDNIYRTATLPGLTGLHPEVADAFAGSADVRPKSLFSGGEERGHGGQRG
jgi:hypothetical protein